MKISSVVPCTSQSRGNGKSGTRGEIRRKVIARCSAPCSSNAWVHSSAANGELACAFDQMHTSPFPTANPNHTERKFCSPHVSCSERERWKMTRNSQAECLSKCSTSGLWSAFGSEDSCQKQSSTTNAASLHQTPGSESCGRPNRGNVLGSSLSLSRDQARSRV